MDWCMQIGQRPAAEVRWILRADWRRSECGEGNAGEEWFQGLSWIFPMSHHLGGKHTQVISSSVSRPLRPSSRHPAGQSCPFGPLSTDPQAVQDFPPPPRGKWKRGKASRPLNILTAWDPFPSGKTMCYMWQVYQSWRGTFTKGGAGLQRYSLAWCPQQEYKKSTPVCEND